MKKAIFICANGVWLDRARIALRSIHRNSRDADIFLFTNQRGFTGISDLSDIQFDYDVEVVQIDVKMPGGNIKNPYPEDSVCLRLQAISYLKNAGYDVALYIDTDAILLRPLPDDFWKQENGFVEDVPFRAFNKKAINVPRMRKDSMKYLIYHNGSRYFNSGIMRVNLHSDEAGNLFDEYLKFRQDPPSAILFPDQDFLNYYLKDNYELLDVRFNSHEWKVGNYDAINHQWINTEKTLQETTDQLYSFTKNHVYILHYAGEFKPWIKPNQKKIKRHHINMAIFWIGIAKETAYLKDETLARINEIEKFIKEFEYDEVDVDLNEFIKKIEIKGAKPLLNLSEFI